MIARGCAARPRRTSLRKTYFFFLAVFLAAFFFLAGIGITSLPSLTRPTAPSEQSALTPGQALGLPGAGQPLLELAAGYPPDPTDPHCGYPRGVRVVHRAETAQDGRGMNTQAAGDLISGQVLVRIDGPCTACTRCGDGA